MAKKPVRARRKVAVSRSAKKPNFVETDDAIEAMQTLLNDLKRAKVGDTGWGWSDYAKVHVAEGLLGLTIKQLKKCTPTQSYPRG